LNIAGEKFAQKIAVLGEDIHEGKRTIMVIHAMKHAPAEKAQRLNVRFLLIIGVLMHVIKLTAVFFNRKSFFSTPTIPTSLTRLSRLWSTLVL
jgi:multisubunit Na+/H+ antiporter MnhB subunit